MESFDDQQNGANDAEGGSVNVPGDQAGQSADVETKPDAAEGAGNGVGEVDTGHTLDIGTPVVRVDDEQTDGVVVGHDEESGAPRVVWFAKVETIAHDLVRKL